MVVNTTPDPVQAMQEDPGRTRKGRVWFFLVWLICAAPVVASYLTFYVFKPTATSSYGELITPPVQIPVAKAQGLDGKELTLETLKGQWLLISVASGSCNQACEAHLYLQRQLRELMGREKERLDWIWLVNDDQAIAPALLPALQSAQVLRVRDDVLKNWLKPSTGQSISDHLYVVDPMGRWMMRFPAQLSVASAAKAKKDLARLLTASASWDKAGRPGSGG